MQEVQKASQTEGDGAAHDDGPYASALAALRAKCPDHVPEERWRRAVEDGQQFLAVWGAQAQAFGWAARELFGLHPVPERPAANYSRLSRLDCTGLIWLLRGRPVIALTAMEAVMRCHSGATLTYRRRTEQALAGTANGAPATETDGTMQQTHGTMQQTHGMVQQTDGTMQQTHGMVQQTDGTMQQTDGMVQQTDGTMQQTDGMVQPTLQLVSDAAEIAGRAV